MSGEKNTNRRLIYAIPRSIKKLVTAYSLLREYGLIVFLEEGWQRAFVSRFLDKKTITRLKVQPERFPILNDSTYRVSVIIPIFNGGPGLAELVSTLLNQLGCEVEVILVDSGSTDGVVETILTDGRVHCIRLDASSFSHSYARNLGLSLAKNDLIFLTVQDAQIPTNTWLFHLCFVKERAGVEALSADEVARSDADVYARFSIASHYRDRSLKQRVTQKASYLPSGRETRLLAASIGNVACLYSKKCFTTLSFTGGFGEDLTIGLALLKLRLAVGQTNELTIVHSHTRPPFYWLKRMYLSRKLLVIHRLSEKTFLRSEEEVLAVTIGAMQLLTVFLNSSEPREILKKRGFTTIDGHVKESWSEVISLLLRYDRNLHAFLNRLVQQRQWKVHGKTQGYIDGLLDLSEFLDGEDNGWDMSQDELLELIVKTVSSRLGWYLGGLTDLLSWTNDDGRLAIEGLSQGV